MQPILHVLSSMENCIGSQAHILAAAAEQDAANESLPFAMLRHKSESHQSTE